MYNGWHERFSASDFSSFLLYFFIFDISLEHLSAEFSMTDPVGPKISSSESDRENLHKKVLCIWRICNANNLN